MIRNRRPAHTQMSLFDAPPVALRAVNMPPEIERELAAGAALAISISGGKDSQAMLTALVQLHRDRAWPGPIFAIHADLGRAEWSQTPDHVRRMAEAAGVDLVIVRREAGDMVDRLADRMNKLAGTGKPFWPSAAQRYCTSDLKRGPINKYLRRYDRVISAEGIRAEESAARGRRQPCEIRSQIQTQSRDAWTWNPIIDWTIDDVWAACGTSAADLAQRRQQYRDGDEAGAVADWPAHVAYVYGNDRLSCALCVLASRNDLEVGARHNPELLAIYIGMEQRSGFTFRSNFSLSELGAA